MSLGRADWCRNHKRARSPFILILVLSAGLVASISLAYATPVDPTWIAGIYDDADYDEVVSLLTDTTSMPNAVVAVKPFKAVVKAAEQMCHAVQIAIPSTMRPRSPPTDTV